jgi:hypothetical protein
MHPRGLLLRTRIVFELRNGNRKIMVNRKRVQERTSSNTSARRRSPVSLSIQ